MTEKKKKPATKPKKKTTKPAGKPKPGTLGRELLKGLTSLIALVFLVGILAMGADYFFNRGPAPVHRADPVKPAPSPGAPAKPQVKTGLPKPRPVPPATKERKPVGKIFEIFDDEPTHPPDIRQPVPDIPPGLPRVAIIIDDIGFDRHMADNLASLDANITLSILPGAPYGRVIAEKVHARGTEIMLHLPMEPVEYPEVDPGPGALLSSMSPDELISKLRADIDSLPHVKGVNNHMGSRLTAVSSTMYQILSVLKQRDMFFIDSRTSRESLCRPSSRLLQVPFAQRDVFLDNIQEGDYIRNQLRTLVAIAEKHGSAIGIGHPYKATYETLKQELGSVRHQITLVPASALVFIQE